MSLWLSIYAHVMTTLYRLLDNRVVLWIRIYTTGRVQCSRFESRTPRLAIETPKTCQPNSSARLGNSNSPMFGISPSHLFFWGNQPIGFQVIALKSFWPEWQENQNNFFANPFCHFSKFFFIQVLPSLSLSLSPFHVMCHSFTVCSTSALKGPAWVLGDIFRCVRVFRVRVSFESFVSNYISHSR